MRDERFNIACTRAVSGCSACRLRSVTPFAAVADGCGDVPPHRRPW